MAQTKLTDLPEVLVADNAMEVLVEDAGTVKKITRANFVDGLASAGTTTAGGTSGGGGVGVGGAVELIAATDLSPGDVVTLNADGTVSAVGESLQAASSEYTDIPSVINATAQGQSKYWVHNSVYDAQNNQSIVLYTTGNNDVESKNRSGTTEMRCFVGHVTPNEAVPDTFTLDGDIQVTPSGFLWGTHYKNHGYISACVVGDKILIWYDSESGAQFQVGAITPGSVSWQSAQSFNDGYHANFNEASAFYDLVNDKVIVAYGAFDDTLDGFSQFASSLNAPVDPHTVQKYHNNGGRRTVGIYNFNGGALSVVGSLFQPTTTQTTNVERYSAAINIVALHAYTPAGTFIEFLGSIGENLGHSMDIYCIMFDRTIFYGWNGASGREWVVAEEKSGGWASTSDSSPQSLTASWDDENCCVVMALIGKRVIDGTYPIQYEDFQYPELHPIKQDSISTAPYKYDSAIANFNLSWGYPSPHSFQLVYSPVHKLFAYSQGSRNYGRQMEVKAIHIYFSTQTHGEWVNGENIQITTTSPTVNFFTSGSAGGSHLGFGYSHSFSGHMVDHAEKVAWFHTSGEDMYAVLHDMGSEQMQSTLENNYFVGFASDTFLTGDSALILTVGAIEDTHTGLVPGTRMFLAPDGSLQSVAGELDIFAGTALTTNKLLVKF
jgi:hypothetical protein